MENQIARWSASGLAMIGVALIASYPITLVIDARERADIDRAFAFLLSVPLNELRAPTPPRFDLTVPNDNQWRRIANRLGSPSFVVVAARAKSEPSRQTLSSSAIGLSVRVSRNGKPVVVEPTSDTPESYSSQSANNGFKFSAEPGDRLNINPSLTTSPPPASILIIAPSWSRSSASAWAEGAGIGAAIGRLLTGAAAIAGLILVWSAFIIAWGRPADADGQLRG